MRGAIPGTPSTDENPEHCLQARIGNRRVTMASIAQGQTTPQDLRGETLASVRTGGTRYDRKDVDVARRRTRRHGMAPGCGRGACRPSDAGCVQIPVGLDAVLD